MGEKSGLRWHGQAYTDARTLVHRASLAHVPNGSQEDRPKRENKMLEPKHEYMINFTVQDFTSSSSAIISTARPAPIIFIKLF